MKILVLGGAGYIGSHTVSELVDAGEDVVIADSLETGHIEAVNPKAKFYQGDIRDKKFIDSVFDNEKIDAVIHFAANSLVGESMTNPLKYYDNNLYGTKVLLQSMVEHDVKKIVEYSDSRIRHDRTYKSIWRNKTFNGKDDEMDRCCTWCSLCCAQIFQCLRSSCKRRDRRGTQS